MKFERPEFLYLLLLNIFFLLFLMKKVKERGKFLNENFKISVNLITEYAKVIVLLIVFSLIVIALSGPYWNYKNIKIGKLKKSIIIALDVSNSMLAKDIAPSRLENAKNKIFYLVNNLSGERVSLICFAGTSVLAIPLTTDYDFFENFLKIIDTNFIKIQGTDFYSLFKEIFKIIKDNNLKNSDIIIFSDGENFGKDVKSFLKKLKEYNVKIYAIGEGKPFPVPIPMKNGGYKKDKNGKIVLTKLNEKFLENLSLFTNGIYVRAVEGFEDIKLILKKINSEEKEFSTKNLTKKIPIDRFRIFVLFAFILFCLYFLIEDKKKVQLIFIFSIFLNPYFLNKEGIKFYKHGKFHKAYEKFLKASKIDNRSEFIYNSALSLYKLGKYKKAKKLFKSVKNKEEAVYNLGVIDYKRGKLKKALEDFKKAIILNPSDLDARIDYELILKKLMHKNSQKSKKSKFKKKKRFNSELNKILNFPQENLNILKNFLQKKMEKSYRRGKDW